MRFGILSSTPDASGRRRFHFPEMMLNLITRSIICCFAVHWTRCSVSDSLAILRQAQDGVCPEDKVVSCRIRKARKAHLRQAGEVILKA